jgi:ketosteroid isomerase-like protein
MPGAEALAILSATATERRGHMSSTDQHTAIVRECFVYATKGDRAGLERILSPDFVIHVPEEHRGVDGLLEMVDTFRSALPDVASRFTVRGTHDGELLGAPPTGRPVAMTGITVSRCEDNRIAEEWELVDVAGLLQQVAA